MGGPRKLKVDIIRKELANRAQPDVILPYWGSCVDEKSALSMSKAMVLPLGDNDGKGPRLFVEGSSACNLRTSRGCIAWSIPPVPKKKKQYERKNE